MNRPLSPNLWISACKLWRNDSVCGQIAQVFEFCPPRYGGAFLPPPMGGIAVLTRQGLWKNYPFFLPNSFHRAYRDVTQFFPEMWAIRSRSNLRVG